MHTKGLKGLTETEEESLKENLLGPTIRQITDEPYSVNPAPSGLRRSTPKALA